MQPGLCHVKGSLQDCHQNPSMIRLKSILCFSEDSSKLIVRCRVRRDMRLPLGAGLDLGRVLACILLLDGCSDLQHIKMHTSCEALQQLVQKAELRLELRPGATAYRPVLVLDAVH